MYKEFDYHQLLARRVLLDPGPLPSKDGKIDGMAKGDAKCAIGAHPLRFLPGAGDAGIRGGPVRPLARAGYLIENKKTGKYYNKKMVPPPVQPDQ
jgi:hypothetical protein